MPKRNYPPPWPPMRDPAMHDDRIDLFVTALAKELTARSLYRSGDLPHESTYLLIPDAYRGTAKVLAEAHGLTLEPRNRYTAAITGETQQLVLTCPAVPPASVAVAVANTYTEYDPQNFSIHAGAALDHLYTGDYGTDPQPKDLGAQALAVLLLDSGLLPTFDGETSRDIWRLEPAYRHAHANDLHEVSRALARKP